MGVDQVTIQNLDIVKVDADLNLIAVRGAVPGPKGCLLYTSDVYKRQVLGQEICGKNNWMR